MTVIYENTTGNDWQSLYAGAWTSDGIGITSGSQSNITQITVYLLKVGSPSGNVQAHIYSCTGSTTCDSSPSASSTTIITASSISTSETGYTFEFSGNPDLSDEDRIVITATGGDSSNYIRLRLTTLSLVSDWARTAYNASSGWYQNSSQNIKGSVEASDPTPGSGGTRLPPPPIVI